jgi:hypothetical protein
MTFLSIKYDTKRIKKNHFFTSKSKFSFLYIFATPKNDMTQNGKT